MRKSAVDHVIWLMEKDPSGWRTNDENWFHPGGLICLTKNLNICSMAASDNRWPGDVLHMTSYWERRRLAKAKRWLVADRVGAAVSNSVTKLLEAAE